MNTKIQELGKVYKNKRQEMNLTLKEIENATSIRTIYLEAIEEGRVDKFLSGVYALGFIKQYGNFLGFDMESMVKKNPEAFKMPSEKQEFSYGIGTLDVRNSIGSSGKWPNFLWIGAAGLILLLAWVFAKFLGLFG